MDLTIIMDLISSIGVPAAVLLAAMWFIKYMYDKNREDLQDQRNRYNTMLEDERTRHEEEMSSVTEALNNNTIALTELTTLLKENKE